MEDPWEPNYRPAEEWMEPNYRPVEDWMDPIPRFKKITDSEIIIALLDDLLDYVVKRIKWEKFEAPVRESYICEACDNEADTANEIKHDEMCVVSKAEALKKELRKGL